MFEYLLRLKYFHKNSYYFLTSMSVLGRQPINIKYVIVDGFIRWTFYVGRIDHEF